MRAVHLRFALVTTLAVLPSVVSAGLNRNYLVPVYAQCQGTAENCTPPTLASAYTFESAILMSTTQRYSGPGKLALILVVKGVKDPSGAPFTGRLTLSTGTSRVTILQQGVGTFRDDSTLAAQAPYPVDVKNGSGKLRYLTPDNTPDSGLRVNSITAPILYDPDGKPLASTGTRTKD
jgi:hypothetical protein